MVHKPNTPISQKPHNVIGLVHSNGCGYCTMFKDEWEKIKTAVQNDKKLASFGIVDIEASDKDYSTKVEKIKGLSVDGYPTIFKRVGDVVEKYAGNRTATDILQWMSKTPTQFMKRGGRRNRTVRKRKGARRTAKRG